MRSLLDAAGGPWFVAADVCRVLGIQNPRQAADQFDEADVSTAEVRSESENGVVQARAFKRWVTKEVLPALRKTGRYTPVENEYHRELRTLLGQMSGVLDAGWSGKIGEARAAVLTRMIREKRALLQAVHAPLALVEDGED